MTLKAEGVSFSYKKSSVQILENISAEFNKSEITAIVGANGCGKTTFCKILMGIYRPLQGTVLVDGTDLHTLSLAEVGKRIGFALQDPEQQLFCKSVREEIEYGLKNLALDQTEIENRSSLFMEYFEIAKYQDRFPFQLSRGEKQRVVLAAILAMKPEYLILDEPTASLDAYRRKILGEYLIKIKEELNCGILIISHDWRFVSNYADKVFEMTKGGRLDVPFGNI